MTYKIVDVEGIGPVYAEKLVAGPQFSELLEAAGVDTVKELKHRKPENLQPKLEEVNAEKKLVRRVPALKEVEKMIAQAAELPAVMEY